MAKKENIIIDQGSVFTKTFSRFPVLNANGSPKDLTSYTGTAKMKKEFDDIAYFPFAINMANTGMITISLTTLQTTALEPRNYVYDIEISPINDANTVVRVFEGIAVVTPSVDGDPNLEYNGFTSPYFPGRAYDLPIFMTGKFASSELLMALKTIRSFSLPISLVGSTANLITAATLSTTFLLKKNGTTFGTATFAPGSTTAVMAAATLTNFAIGDILTIVAPASPDATAETLFLTLSGTIT